MHRIYSYLLKNGLYRAVLGLYRLEALFSGLKADFILSTPGRENLINIIRGYWSKESAQLKELYFNKKVAILGPMYAEGPPPLSDVFIVFNAHEDQNLMSYDGLIVTYFTSFGVEKMMRYNKKPHSLVDFVIILQDVNLAGLRYLSQYVKVIISPQKLGEDLFNYGGLNGAQRVTIDVLNSQPKSLHLFNMDLQLSYGQNKNVDSYRLGHEKDVFTDAFVYHEPILNFRFLWVLYANNMIIVDPILESILSKGITAYLNALKKRFKSFI